jgi:hypothetical protein
MVHRQGTNDYLVGLIIRGGRSALKTAGPSAELTTTRYNSTPLRWNEIFHCYALNETRHLESTAKPSIRASHPPGNSVSLSCLPRTREGGVETQSVFKSRGKGWSEPGNPSRAVLPPGPIVKRH